MPRQNLLPATSYFRSRICTGTMLRSGCFFRRVVCEPSDGEMVTTLSVSVLAENSWITEWLVAWRRKIAWMPVCLW